MAPKKIKYAEYRMAGNSRKQSALLAGYAAGCASVTASRLEQDKGVLAYWARRGWSESGPVDKPAIKAAPPVSAKPPTDKAPPSKGYADPLAYFEHVMNDSAEDPKIRLDAAKSLASFTVAKPGEAGKKEQKNDEAKKVAGGRFAPAPPPLSVVKS